MVNLSKRFSENDLVAAIARAFPDGWVPLSRWNVPPRVRAESLVQKMGDSLSITDDWLMSGHELAEALESPDLGTSVPAGTAAAGIVARVKHNRIVEERENNSKRDRLKVKLSERMADITGGPEMITGRELEAALGRLLIYDYSVNESARGYKFRDSRTATLAALRKRIFDDVAEHREPEYVIGAVYKDSRGMFFKRVADGWLIFGNSGTVLDGPDYPQRPLTKVSA